MGLYKELQKEYNSNILNITVEIAQYIFIVGFISFLAGIIMTILCWEQFVLIPLLIGSIVFIFSYMKSLKLLFKIKQYNIETLIYLQLEDLNTDIVDIKKQLINLDKNVYKSNKIKKQIYKNITNKFISLK